MLCPFFLGEMQYTVVLVIWCGCDKNVKRRKQTGRTLCSLPTRKVAYFLLSTDGWRESEEERTKTIWPVFKRNDLV